MASSYEVGILLSITGNAQAGLGAIAGQIAKINVESQKLSKTFDAWKSLTIGGMFKSWGEEAARGIGKAVTAGAAFIQIQKQIGVMGATNLETQKATAEAIRLSTKYANVSATTMLEMIRDAKQIFGTSELATAHAEVFAKLASFQAAWEGAHTGGKHVNIPQEVQAAVKSAEINGATSPAAMDAYIEKFVNARIATDGNVSSQMMLTAQRIAGPAFRAWSEDFRLGVFPALVQEYGVKAGTMASTSFSKLGAGNFWSKTNFEGVKLGLIDPSKVEYDKTGRPMRLKEGGNIYGAEEARDPLKYVEERIKPALDRLYGDDIAGRAGSLTRLGGTANIGRFLTELDAQMQKLEKDRLLPSQVSKDKSSIMGDDNFFKQLQAVQAQWTNLMTALGAPSVGLATTALKGIADALNGLYGAALAHPDMAKNLLAVAAALSALGIALGTLAIGAGIIGLLGGGSIVVGLTALGVVLATLVAVNWDTVSGGLKAVGNAIADLWNKIKGLAGFGGGGGPAEFGSPWNHQTSGTPIIGKGQYASLIKQYGGAQADNLLKIYGTEGAGGYIGDHGSSFGPFQLHYGGVRGAGAGNQLGGMGDQFTRDTGLDARNPSTVRQQVEWMVNYGNKHHGYSSSIWHGLRGHGGSLGSPMEHPRPGRQHESMMQPIHNHFYVDGKKMAQNVMMHTTRAATHATSVAAAPDGHGTFLAPGAESFG